jgi:parallel beta-helix repeat protein
VIGPYSRIASLACCTAALLGCSSDTGAEAKPGKVTIIENTPEAQKRAQTALINAEPGDTIEFAEGRFSFTSTLSLDVSHVTIQGRGKNKTILSFAEQGQGTGGEGLLVKSKEKFTLENLAIEDAKGDAVKVQDTQGVTLRNVRVEWTGGAKETNGAYGLYPVMARDVLIEDCVVKGASDAGIYVGQSENIIVRGCRAEMNVAGIEIENSVGADVYKNVATDNAGGILVFTLPDLPKKDGRNCRVHDNQVIANNHVNFAPKGNIVATVPSGTGMMVMANDFVEVFDNTIENNQTSGLMVVSYLVTQKPINDPGYDAYCEAIYVHDNKFAANGDKPAGLLGTILGAKLGGKLPDIVFDGAVDEKKLVGGKLPEALGLRIRNNGDADFVNFDVLHLKLNGLAPPTWGEVSQDLKPFEGVLAAIPPVAIPGADGVKK